MPADDLRGGSLRCCPSSRSAPKPCAPSSFELGRLLFIVLDMTRHREKWSIRLGLISVVAVAWGCNCDASSADKPAQEKATDPPIFESLTAEELCIRMGGEDSSISQDDQNAGRRESWRLKGKRLRLTGKAQGKAFVTFGGHPQIVLTGRTYLAGTSCRLDLSFPERDPEVESKVLSVSPGDEVTADCVFESGSYRGVDVETCRLLLIGTSRVQ